MTNAPQVSGPYLLASGVTSSHGRIAAAYGKYSQAADSVAQSLAGWDL
jgi:hypothetical protein